MNSVSNSNERKMLDSDDIISRLIHQIRNPLATIIISASQIDTNEDGIYDVDDKMLIGFINSEANRIEKLLTKYSKLVSSSKLIKRETKVRNLLESLHVNCRTRCDSEVTIEFEDDNNVNELILNIDESKVTEALAQILENGIENIKNNNGKITITGSHEDGHVRISIRDNGPGIRPEELRKVKEPFYSTKDGGSGLGLTIASSIALAHGGDVSINSAEGRETEVSLVLPCK